MKFAGQSRVQKVIRVFMIVCFAGIICSGTILILNQRQYDKGDQVYEQIREMKTIPDTPIIQAPLPQENQDIGKEEAPAKINFVALNEINTDIVGWIRSSSAEIDYPVVQGQDNDYYLRRLFTKEKNKLGALFIDYRNNRNFTSKNTIIYGHNMKDGSMFASLLKYKDQKYFDRYPTMQLDTVDGSYTLELFAGMAVDGNYESVRRDFDSDEDFENYIESVLQASNFKSNTVVDKSDYIVTLCTCSYEFSNARYAVFGKLVPNAV